MVPRPSSLPALVARTTVCERLVVLRRESGPGDVFDAMSGDVGHARRSANEPEQGDRSIVAEDVCAFARLPGHVDSAESRRTLMQRREEQSGDDEREGDIEQRRGLSIHQHGGGLEHKECELTSFVMAERLSAKTLSSPFFGCHTPKNKS